MIRPAHRQLEGRRCAPLGRIRSTRAVLPVLLCASLLSSLSQAQAPALPEGLDEQPPAGPASPTGLGGSPALPEGLGGPEVPEGLQPETPVEEQPPTPPAEPAPNDWLVLSGFWEVRGGVRTQRDPHERQASLGETRLQLETEKTFESLTFRFTGDFLYDAAISQHSVDLDRGEGWFDLREASVAATPVEFMDVKLGRQILTWGTGDLIFINDLFPKDYVSFFAGRDVEYLKAPSDAIKLGFFSDLANLDVVYTPAFDPDRFLIGRRISFYNPQLGRSSGRDAVLDPDIPNQWFRDDEWAARVFRTVGAYELAAYGYWGRWKSPAGFDPASGRATFPRLNVYGASVRGPAAGGIANLEGGYYQSRDDENGDDPFVNNSQLRLLAGYERDLPELFGHRVRDLTVGVQYYLEHIMDYQAMQDAAPPGAKLADQCRHTVTFRITKLLMNQNLKLSLFTFYTPSDSDAYLRPNVSYKIDDHWTAEFGGNVWIGAHDHTFWGQFERNSNVYASLRYGF